MAYLQAHENLHFPVFCSYLLLVDVTVHFLTEIIIKMEATAYSHSSSVYNNWKYETFLNALCYFLIDHI